MLTFVVDIDLVVLVGHLVDDLEAELLDYGLDAALGVVVQVLGVVLELVDDLGAEDGLRLLEVAERESLLVFAGINEAEAL